MITPSGNLVVKHFHNPNAALVYAVDSGSTKFWIDNLTWEERVKLILADFPSLFRHQAEELAEKWWASREYVD